MDNDPTLPSPMVCDTVVTTFSIEFTTHGSLSPAEVHYLGVKLDRIAQEQVDRPNWVNAIAEHSASSATVRFIREGLPK